MWRKNLGREQTQPGGPVLFRHRFNKKKFNKNINCTKMCFEFIFILQTMCRVMSRIFLLVLLDFKIVKCNCKTNMKLPVRNVTQHQCALSSLFPDFCENEPQTTTDGWLDQGQSCKMGGASPQTPGQSGNKQSRGRQFMRRRVRSVRLQLCKPQRRRSLPLRQLTHGPERHVSPHSPLWPQGEFGSLLHASDRQALPHSAL